MNMKLDVHGCPLALSLRGTRMFQLFMFLRVSLIRRLEHDCHRWFPSYHPLPIPPSYVH